LVVEIVQIQALVLTDLADTLMQNPLAIALLGDQTRHTCLARSAYHRCFTDPAERTHYPDEDHPRQSRIQAAALRAALRADGSNPRAAQIVAEQ
jgi:MmyB-like transcription regulator ligand binding domain